MTEISKIMQLREKLDNPDDIRRLDGALETLGMAFKTVLMTTKAFMTGEKPERVDVGAAKKAVEALNELGEGKGYSLPRFETDKQLMDFIIKFGSEIVNR